jgi:predicted DNA-binding antitoxin AbrB/MazE fold protein
MIQQIDAIFDNGVFKPLVPVSIPDQAHVKLTVDAESTATLEGKAEPFVPPPSNPEVLARQNAALEQLRRDIDKLPQTKNNDGWSVRQHDDLLYGGKK